LSQVANDAYYEEYKDARRESQEKQIELRIFVDAYMVTKLRFHFEALGLMTTTITKSTRQTGMFNEVEEVEEISWKLTERGRRYVVNMNAIKRQVTNV
jgi:hypothetical protein